MKHNDCLVSWEGFKERSAYKTYPSADMIKEARELFSIMLSCSANRKGQIASDVCSKFPGWNMAAAIDDVVTSEISTCEGSLAVTI